MRCQGQLIFEGDTPYDVKRKCGDPLDKISYQINSPVFNAYGIQIGSHTENVEAWIYQESPAAFRYELIFDKGRVKEIKANRNQ